MIVERKMIGKIVRPQQIVVDRLVNRSWPEIRIQGVDIDLIPDLNINQLLSAEEIKLYISPPITKWEPEPKEILKYDTNCTMSKDEIITNIPPCKFFPYFIPNIEKVVFNNPATIVFWATGEKTGVKCQDDEPFDKEKGLALCVMKYVMGNKSSYNNIIKKFVEEN